jgi:hypothetical protein
MVLESALTMLTDGIPVNAMRTIRGMSNPIDGLDRLMRHHMPEIQGRLLPALQRRLDYTPTDSMADELAILNELASGRLSRSDTLVRLSHTDVHTKVDPDRPAGTPLPQKALAFQDAMGPMATWMGDGPPMELVFERMAHAPFYVGTLSARGIANMLQVPGDYRCIQSLPGCPDNGCEDEGGTCYRRGKFDEQGKLHVECDCSVDHWAIPVMTLRRELPVDEPPVELPERVVIQDIPGSGCITVGLYQCDNVGCAGDCRPLRNIDTILNSEGIPKEKVITVSCHCGPKRREPPENPPMTVPAIPPEVNLAIILALIIAAFGIWGLGLAVKAGVMMKAGMSAAAILAAIGISRGG